MEQAKQSLTWGGRRWWLNGGYFCNRRGELLHRAIYIAAHGSILEGNEIHHRDGNKTNNALENLESLTCTEHRRKHNRNGAAGSNKEVRQKVAWEYWQKREPYECICDHCVKPYLTRATRSRYCSGSCKAAARRKDPDRVPEAVCLLCGGPFLLYKKALLFCSKECNYRAKQKPLRSCAHCGKDFRAPGTATVCCSRKCGYLYRFCNKHLTTL